MGNRPLTLAAASGHDSAAFPVNARALALAEVISLFSPFVVELLQEVPFRRRLWRGAAALLLLEVTADIFHRSDAAQVGLYPDKCGRNCG